MAKQEFRLKKSILVIFLFIALAGTASAADLSNFVECWDGNNTLTGYNSTAATWTGAAYTADGYNGSAFNASGNNNALDTVFDLDTSTFTIAFWAVIPSGDCADSCTLVSNWANELAFFIGGSNYGGKFRWKTEPQGGGSDDNLDSSVSTSSYKDDEWHHYTLVVDEATNYKAIYIDGALEVEDTGFTDDVQDNAVSVKAMASDGSWFDGLMDTLVFYETLLNSTDVLSLNNTLTSCPAIVSGEVAEPEPVNQILNVSFYDNETSVLLDFVTIDINITSNNFTNIYNTTTGNLYLDTLEPNNYTIYYNATDYGARDTDFELNYNTTLELNVSLHNVTSTMNFTFVDQDEGNVIDFTRIWVNITAVNASFNYSQVFSTTNGLLQVYPLESANYTFTFNATHYTTNTTTFEILNNTVHAQNFTLFNSTATMNITFRDEITNSLLNGLNITLELISLNQSFSYWTVGSNITIFPAVPKNWTLRYSAEGYQERLYEFEAANNTVSHVTLYMLNESLSTNVTGTVIDENADAIEGSVIRVLRYDNPSGQYREVEAVGTNFDGEGQLHLTLGTELYQFIIVVNDEIKKITNPSYIYSTEITFQVNLEDLVTTEFQLEENIIYTLNFSNTTDEFTYVFADNSNTITQSCLRISRIVGTQETHYNETCVAAFSGTVVMGITPVNGSTYIAKAFYSSPEERFLASLKHTYSDIVVTGPVGLFLALLLSLVMGFAGLALAGPAGAFIAFPIPFMVLTYIGFISFPAAIAFVAIGLVCIYLVRDNA